jgi:hypothetical protein
LRCNVLYMNTTQTPTTVTLSRVAGRVAVTAAGRNLGTVKDGGQIVRNAERILRAAGIVRTGGYDLDAERNMVAPAVVLGA